MSTSPDMADRFEAAAHLAAAALDATGVVAFAVVGEPRPLAGARANGAWPAAVVEVLRDAASKGNTLTIPLAATHSLLEDVLPDGGPVAALISVPVFDSRGAASACLCAWADAPRPWSPSDVDLLRSAARLASDADRPGDWLDAVLERMPVGVLLARAPGGEPVRTNAELRRLLGPEAQGGFPTALPLFDAGGEPLARASRPLERALMGEVVEAEVLCTEADPEAGGARWWRVNAAPIRVGDAVEGVVMTIEDVSEARNTQQALYRSQEHLLHAQKMEAVGRLAGGMAHDFNNLLTAIMGFGELLLEGIGGDDPVRRDAEEIVRSASRGRDLTNQLLSFSRRKATRPVVVDLNDGVSSGLRLLERLLRADITLETDLDGATGAVRVDRTELEQILVNLTLNGRDALPPEGGRIRIETRPVHLARTLDAEPEAIPAGHWETLTVRDDGSGMDATLRLRIFEPFFTTKPAGQGTGLGLATVYGIVKRFGGYIRVDSRVGEGTSFGVYFPPAAQVDEQAEATEAPPPRIGWETVLLVEDQAQIRALLARQLERSGFQVLEANNGYEALTLWREHSDDIDIIVSDVVMPVMDGPTLVDRVRAQAPDLPVVFVSGYPGAADPSERETPLPESRFLRKPFAASELVAAIRASLDEAPGTP